MPRLQVSLQTHSSDHSYQGEMGRGGLEAHASNQADAGLHASKANSWPRSIALSAPHSQKS